jgi:hypothetical protein
MSSKWSDVWTALLVFGTGPIVAIIWGLTSDKIAWRRFLGIEDQETADIAGVAMMALIAGTITATAAYLCLLKRGRRRKN